MSESFEIAVIGGGAAGTMAAMRGVLNNRATVLFTGDLDAKRRSRAQWVSSIENMPVYFGQAYPLPHSLQAFQDWLEPQPLLKERFTPIKASIHTLTREGDGFRLAWTEKRRRDPVGTPRSIFARYVVLATGIMDIQPYIGGSIEPIFPFANANQVLYCLRCDGHRSLGLPTVVIGHTESAAWTAIQLHERYAPPELQLLTHGQPFAGSHEVRALMERYGIGIRSGTIEGIVGVARKEGLQGFTVDGALVPCRRAFVALGTMVYHDLAVQLGAAIDARGYVVTGPSGETTAQDLYAVGDLQAGRIKQVYTAWDTAVAAVDDIDLKIRLERRRAASL